MQSITALAHLKACILFFIDISETCGYSLETQMALFEGIKPLFLAKPHLLILTKTDLKKVSDLSEENQDMLKNFIAKNNLTAVELSNQVGDTVFDVKKTACDVLLNYRMTNEEKNINKNAVLKREEDYLKGVKVFAPTMKRDNKSRGTTVPQDILEGKKHVLGRPNLKEMQEEHGGAGVFEFPINEHFILKDPNWKYDIVPEIIDGKNIFDFIDPEIEEKLRLLEEEEEAIMAEEGIKMEDDELPHLNEEQSEAYHDIKMKLGEKRVVARQERNNMVTTKKIGQLSGLKAKLEARGRNADIIVEKLKDRVKKRQKVTLREMMEKQMEDDSDNEMDMEDFKGNSKSTKSKSRSRSRLNQSQIRDESRHRTPQIYDEDANLVKLAQDKKFRHRVNVDHTDRKITNDKPKHLFSGKAGFKRDYR